jgi:hypothetical protein
MFDNDREDHASKPVGGESEHQSAKLAHSYRRYPGLTAGHKRGPGFRRTIRSTVTTMGSKELRSQLHTMLLG